MHTLDDLKQEVYKTAVDKGWWEEERTLPELLMLVVSECSEAVEAYRDGYQPAEVRYYGPSGTYHPDFHCSEVCNKPEGIPIELADVIIRVLDMSGKLGIDIQEAVRIKMEYNRTRPYRHGGKLL